MADDNVEYLWLEWGEVYFEVPVALRGHTVRILCGASVDGIALRQVESPE